MNQAWKNSEKPNFGPILARLTQIWAPTFFFESFNSTRYQILSQAIIVCNFKEKVWSKFNKMTKNLILDLIWARCPQIRVANLFFKNLALSLLRYHGQLLSCTILEKANDSILRKLSDERTDRQIDRRARVISYGAVQLTSSVQYKLFSRRTTISFKFKNCRKET